MLSAGRNMVRFFLLLVLACASPVIAQTSVLTYHNDNYRTGWNSHETALIPANVNASQFGLLAAVQVDDQVDAEPLLVPGVNITVGAHPGVHDTVYIVTGNDTVYAIDANSGTILLRNHLGSPVPTPLGCTNNGPNVGITGTPVIDLTQNSIYLIAYTLSGSTPTYTLHALDLGSLSDKIPPQVVAGSHVLSDGSTFSFNATYQRQRPSLLEANGNVYAGFGSFCDYYPDLTRGWVLGWNATTLAPLTANELTDTQVGDSDDYFLSSIWMSGWGLAADDSGNVVFVTGNSDYAGTSYDGITDVQESVVKVSPDLSTLVDIFTPDDQVNLDENDTDFGSGGAMILPDQPNTIPHLAVAAGKDGNMYFMNEDDLGGYSPTTNNVLGTYQIGKCFCGASYFVDPHDGLARVVSSGSSTLEVWKLVTSPKTRLAAVSHAPLSSGQRGGFFTSISSNGNSNPIIWALARPTSRTNSVPTLYALNPDSGGSIMTTLYRGSAGSWPNWGSGFNQVPMVANGKVYVATNKQLRIFGLKSGKKN